MDMEKVVQAHGANVGAACSVCKKEYDRELLDQHIEDQKIFRCENLKENGDEICEGPIKPNIVFFGEKMNPKWYWGLSLCAYKHI
jgi:NAD-dependent SIR2 family protein deacetylase